jgi:hypothetical protein
VFALLAIALTAAMVFVMFQVVATDAPDFGQQL